MNSNQPTNTPKTEQTESKEKTFVSPEQLERLNKQNSDASADGQKPASSHALFDDIDSDEYTENDASEKETEITGRSSFYDSQYF